MDTRLAAAAAATVMASLKRARLSESSMSRAEQLNDALRRADVAEKRAAVLETKLACISKTVKMLSEIV